MNAADFKELGLSGEAIFVLIALMFVLQIIKFSMDWAARLKRDTGATHEDILAKCQQILDELHKSNHS